MATRAEAQAARRATNPEASQYESTLDRFNEKLAEFRAVYDALRSKEGVANLSPELRAEYVTLMDRASYIQSLIERATTSIDWVRQQLKQAGSAFDGLEGLGIIPLIAWGAAVAAMTGAITAMAYWISGAYEWSKRAEIAERVANAGGTPDEISKALDAGGIMGKFGGLLLLAGIGYLLWAQPWR